MPRRSPLSLIAAALAASLSLAPASAGAQGIGFSVTPSVEEVRWGEELLIPNTVFPGGLLSAHFGRFVSLDAHYFRARTSTVAGGGNDVVPSRWGGDVRVVLSPSSLAPFVRAGAGVLEFRPDIDGATPSRHLTTSLQGGVRIAVRDRLAGEVTARRLFFRAGPGSGVAEDHGSPDPHRDFSTLALGLGLQIPLGGTWNDPETDEAVRSLRTLSFPVQLFGGALDFSDALGLERHPVVGAVLGADFGPFVGAGLYTFGSAKDGLGSPDELYGYGLEGSFNLVRRGAWATPHVLLGGGRLHFTEDDRVAAGLDDRRAWTATVGGGIDFRVTDRLRGEVAARNLVLTQRETATVTSPDQLRANWLYSGGVQWVLGRGSRSAGTAAATPGRVPAAATTAAPERPGVAEPTPRPTTTPQDVEAFELERDRLIRELEVERLRQALARLREEGDPAAAERLLAEYRGDPVPAAAPRSFEVPVLEQGEFRVRFGPEGGSDSTRAAAAPPPLVPAAPSEAPRDPRVDRLLESVGRLEGRLEELLAGRPVAPGADVRVEVTGAVPGALAPGWTWVTREVAPRGVLRGDAPGLRGVGLYAGARLDPRSQTVAGLEVDLGSAFGGGIRFRPDIAFGLTDGLSWGVNANAEWPTPVLLWGTRPTLGGGIGLMRDEGVTRVMVPNVSFGVVRPLTGTLDGFVTFQTLDMFDDRRLVAGVRLRPRPGPATRTVTVQVPVTAAPGFVPVPSQTDPPRPAATPDVEMERERAAVQAALDALRTEVGQLRTELSVSEAATREAEQRAREVEEARRAAEAAAAAVQAEATPAGDPLLEAFLPLGRLESVQSVRRVARGVAVVVGGGDTFGVGDANLSSLAHSEIASIAALLVQGGYEVSVEGHTDSTGAAELNQRLSQARADAVRAALLAHGLAPSRASAVGFGPTRPVAGNGTVEGRAANRRVEIVVQAP